MICGKDIRQSLKKCEELYNINKADSYTQQLILKLSLLELCGWIEVSFDQLYYSVAKTTEERKIIGEKIKNCYSFKYDKFQDMLCLCIGIQNYNMIKNKFTEQNFQLFKGALGDLSQQRDKLAHNNHNFQSPQYLGINILKKYCGTILKSINKIQKELSKL